MNRFIKYICPLLFCCLIMLISGCGGYDEHVMQVRNGIMLINEVVPSSIAPNAPKIGDAFDQLLKDGNWRSFETSSRQRIVEYNGTIVQSNTKQQHKILMQFMQQHGRYVLSYFELDGQPQNQLSAIGFINGILSHYVPPTTKKK